MSQGSFLKFLRSFYLKGFTAGFEDDAVGSNFLKFDRAIDKLPRPVFDHVDDDKAIFGLVVVTEYVYVKFGQVIADFVR
jgi:hypothetical protein